MSQLSRRKLITSALGATAGVAGIAVTARLADRNGFTPPECTESTARATP